MSENCNDYDRRKFDILPMNPKVLKDINKYDDPRIMGLFCRYPRNDSR